MPGSTRSWRAAAAAGAATATSRRPRARRRASPRRACRARSAGSRSSSSCSRTRGWSVCPNAGKSSLLAALTRARPKVADYPFTTLEPVLGTLERDDRQLVLADIPGLIEGASAGAGLGHEFLAHVERCRLLVHVLDLAPLDGSDPVANHATVEAELREHGHGLADLPRILCLSKADLVPPGRGRGGRARLAAARLEIPVLATSAATGRRRARAARRDLRARAGGGRPEAQASEQPATHRVYRPGAGDSFTRRARRRRAPSGWRAAASTG